jgi:uncharacterized protein YukE
MTEFTVRHSQLEEANTAFNAAVRRAIQIVSELNAVLQNAGQATQGRAVPLWGDLQAQWNAVAQDLNTRLESGARSSLAAHDAFRQGDDQSVRIMS